MLRTTHRARLLVSAFALALLAAGSMAQLSAAAPAAPTAAPTVWSAAEVSLNLSDSHGPTLIVAATLPEGTALPAQVSLPIPPGAQIQWAGEVLGGPLENDPSVEYETVDTATGTLVTFTLTKALTGQVEMTPPQGFVTTNPPGAALTWTPAAPVGAVRLGVLMPAGSTVTSATPGAAAAPGEGVLAYAREVANAPAGTPLELAVQYTPPAAGAPVQGGTQSSSALPWLFALGVIIALIAFLVPKKRATDDADDEDDATEDEEVPARTAKPTKTIAAERTDMPAPKSAAPANDAAAEEPRPRRGFQPKHAVVLVILALFIGLAYIASAGQPGTVTREGDSITKIVSRADGDAEATFAIASLEGSDLDHESSHMFQAVESIPGVSQVTLTATPLQMIVEYDSSVVQEEALAEALTQAGYLQPASVPTTATP